MGSEMCIRDSLDVAENPLDDLAQRSDERQAARGGEQGRGHRHTSLDDSRRLLVPREHRGVVVAFLELDVAELHIAAESHWFLIRRRTFAAAIF